jgi:SNF2 family DNA or RNA helicase
MFWKRRKAMIFTPHSYQDYMVKYILANFDQHKNTGAFLDMGLGKTAITLTAISELMYKRFEISKVLVVAPPMVAETNWSEEIEKWDQLKYLRYSLMLGDPKQRIKALEADADIWVISMCSLKWLVDLKYNDWPFDVVVIDEIANFKDQSSNRFKAAREILPYLRLLIGLTGTPAPNSLMDLWAPLYLLDRGKRLGDTQEYYENRYFYYASQNSYGRTNLIAKPEAQGRIFEKISDICVSMRASDWLDMPEKVDNFIKIQLPSKAQALYDQFERDLLLPLVDEDTEIIACNAGVLSGKLLQMANGAIYDADKIVHEIHDAKLQALKELIDSVNGRPVLVAYSFKHDLDRAFSYLKGYKVRLYKGAKDKADWNNGLVPIMFVHPASCGEGLNLQAGGNIIIWFGQTWNLRLYLQLRARLLRQGQKSDKVFIHHLIVKGSMDEKVIQRLHRKDKTQSDLIEATLALKDMIARYKSIR